MGKRMCTKCEALFESTKEQEEGLKCYDCALAEITGGCMPEEGDMNTARIISGTLTQEEEEWLMEDLRKVEGAGIEYCPDCGNAIQGCTCDSPVFGIT